MSDSRRDKALEDLARELGETNKLLAKIERNTRRVTVTNMPYATGVNVQEMPDPYAQPQIPQPTEAGKDKTNAGPQFPSSDHSYFKKRYPDGEAREHNT